MSTAEEKSRRGSEEAASRALWTAVLGNGVAAAIGFAVGLVIVRALGVTDFGIYGMLTAAASVCTNALDLRLGDATMRRFFVACDGTEERRGGGLAILVAGAIAQGIVAVLLAVATLAAVLVLRPHLSTGELSLWIVIAFSVSEAVAYAARYLIFSLRMTGRMKLLVRCDLTVAVLRAAIVCGALFVRPNLAGLVTGLVLASAMSLLVAAAAFVHSWVVVMGLRTSPEDVRLEIRRLLGRRRELFAFNTLNYQNLLHRGADVLVCGLLAGEREAGIYKLARSLTDGFYVLYDAAGKTFQPRLLALVGAGSFDDLRAFAWRAAGLAALATVIVLVLEVLLLEPLLLRFFGEAFVAARTPIVLLSAAAFFVFGIQLWAWPLVVAERRVGAYAATALLAACFGQYALGIGGVVLGVADAASWFALAYLASYLVLWTAFLPTTLALLNARAVGVPAVSIAEGRS